VSFVTRGRKTGAAMIGSIDGLLGVALTGLLGDRPCLAFDHEETDSPSDDLLDRGILGLSFRRTNTAPT